MKIFALDFETYWDRDYKLSHNKMTTEEYVRGERFEAHGAAVVGPGIRKWMVPEELKEQLETWSLHSKGGGEPIALCAHHAQFDGLILDHHFDYRPDAWLCTLSMGRMVFGSGLRLGLDHLAEYFGLSPKTVPYSIFEGKHWHELSPAEQTAVAEGAIHDCELTLQACFHMLNGTHSAVPYPFPMSELPVVDLTIRMFTEPCLVGDLEALGRAWVEENELRKNLFERLSAVLGYSVDESTLRKDAQFAAALEALGIEPEPKTTAKGNVKYAFAKSDYFMQNLVSEPDPDVALLAEARLKAHSSIYQTRTERFGWIATRGPIPIYLAYGAAHTRRWGGGDKQNAQNLPACRDPKDPIQYRKGALRRAIKAP
jgi:hypothetical protein